MTDAPKRHHRHGHRRWRQARRAGVPGLPIRPVPSAEHRTRGRLRGRDHPPAGQTFSLNGTIKERTPEHGYTEGIVIGPGGVFREDFGGGVSTAATTTWTAAFFAGMERIEIRAHSIYISRYQPGLEATVAWGVSDMRFRNDSPMRF